MADVIFTTPTAKTQNISGQRFGKLVALSFTGTRSGKPLWLCACDCGNQCIRLARCLCSKNSTKSCGCIVTDFCKSHAKHRMGHTRIYGIWRNMRYRCNNSKCSMYRYYGGRGIRICDRWGSFEAFLADMGERPTAQHSLDRIDNDGNYEPSNCRWATHFEQHNHTNATHNITLNGITKCIAEWARSSGINLSTLQSRIRRGWSPERALSK